MHLKGFWGYNIFPRVFFRENKIFLNINISILALCAFGTSKWNCSNPPPTEKQTSGFHCVLGGCKIYQWNDVNLIIEYFIFTSKFLQTIALWILILTKTCLCLFIAFLNCSGILYFKNSVNPWLPYLLHSLTITTDKTSKVKSYKKIFLKTHIRLLLPSSRE